MTKWLAILLFASSAWAQTVVLPDTSGKGVLTSGQVATGGSQNAVDTTGGYQSAVFTYLLTSGGTSTATIQTEINCEKVVNGQPAAAVWTPVSNSAVVLTFGGTVTAGIGVTFPYCVYRTNVTNCQNSCAVTTKYALGRIK